MIIHKRCVSLVTILLPLAVLSGCDGGNTGMPYDQEKVVATMNYLDQQAYVIWGNSGSEWDAEGERELFPTTDEGWQKLAEAGKELVRIGEELRDYIDEDDPRAEAWLAYSAAISEVSQKLIAAAQEQDKKATFDEGGVLYQVCKACHGTFPPPTEE